MFKSDKQIIALFFLPKLLTAFSPMHMHLSDIIKMIFHFDLQIISVSALLRHWTT